MKLNRYLEAENIKLRDFASQIDVANAGVVSKYASGGRVPRPAIMQRIVEATDGAVQPNDFYRANGE